MQGKTSFMGFNAQYIEIYFSRSASYNQIEFVWDFIWIEPPRNFL